ncbi:RidA family protein [Pseudarthrobacter sp. IC2-21]|uniref:RidA family protein n=1 Tax=Pseudarthrobacter sp. IC2-21 TaxID=3092262 RepID=UPI002A6A0A43|nr:RidA family protein [Pseudarthrobacter sp. IC2-21]
MNPEITSRLSDLELQLPQASLPKYAYEATTRWGGLLFVSGQIPRRDGVIEFTGTMDPEKDINIGVRAAELCALNILAQVEAAVGLENVDRLLKLNGYVASSSDFFDQPLVIDGASKLLRSVLGEAGGHSRTALGVRMLPANSMVEIEALFGLRE